MKYKTTNVLRLAKTVRQKVQKENLFNSWHNLLITFSGGQDSAFCVLVLYLLQNKRTFTWNRKKLLDFSKQYVGASVPRWKASPSPNAKPFTEREAFTQSERTLIKQRSTPLTNFYIGFPHKNKDVNVTKPILHNLGLKKMFMSIKQIDLIKYELLKKRDNGIKKVYCLWEQGNKTEDFARTHNEVMQQNRKLTNSFAVSTGLVLQDSASLVNNYTLLWCNHFWQRDSFFTMEHVSKLTFCKSYATYLFAPVKKVLSEQSARNWRHKAVQRSSCFLSRTMYHCSKATLFSQYEFIELHLNSVLIITPPLFFCVTKVRPKALFELSCAKPDNLNKGKFNRTLIKPEQKFVTKLKTRWNLLPVRVCKNRTVRNQSRACLQKRNFRIQASKTKPEQLCVQGHNKSDRAEAILFNLIRGTGMNGISTLRWKHTFSYPFNSNHTFYPRLSDFFKEIRIISLDSLLFKSCRQRRTLETNKLCGSKAVLQKRSCAKPKTRFGFALQNQTFLQREAVPIDRNTILAKTLLFRNFFVQNRRLCKTEGFARNARLQTQFKPVIKLGVTNKIMDTTIENTVNSDQFELRFFSKNSHIKTFYYQLKYKDKSI